MKRGRKPRPLSSAAIAKLKEKERIEALYYAERKKLFSGDEEFMNTLHPFEDSKKGCGKKSSPFQKALISCIKENNGTATEQQLLDYVTKKWDIILKYSQRGFSMDPTLRVVRLNLAVRKKARHLFLKDPNNSDSWIINSNPRKLPNKRTLFKNLEEDVSDEEIEFQNEEEEIVVESEPDVINESYIMRKDTFERYFEDYIRTHDKSFTIDELVTKLSDGKSKGGLFSCLPFDRRIRACLVVLKSEGRVFYDESSNTWSNHKTLSKIEKIQSNGYRLTDTKFKTLTIDELYENIKNKGLM